MKLEIDIDDAKLLNLSTNANDQLVSISKKYVEDILDEASRIEATRNSTGSNPEITATIIKDAVDFSNKFKKGKKKKFIHGLLQLVSFILSTFTGALFQVDKFNIPSNFYWFMIVFLGAVLLNVAVYFSEYLNE